MSDDLARQSLIAQECYIKKSFPTSNDANYAIQRYTDDNMMKAYRCPFCSKFHIGFTNRPRWRRM